jgi:hypothetical protein
MRAGARELSMGDNGAERSNPHPALSRRRERARSTADTEKGIIIHSLDHARAALAAARAVGCRVTLESAPGAGASAGPAWFVALTALVQREFPGVAFDAVLDCGDEAGTTLGALRAGIRRVRFHGSEEAARRLAGVALQLGAALERGRPGQALDLLGEPRPEAAALAFLAGNVASD